VRRRTPYVRRTFECEILLRRTSQRPDNHGLGRGLKPFRTVRRLSLLVLQLLSLPIRIDGAITRRRRDEAYGRHVRQSKADSLLGRGRGVGACHGKLYADAGAPVLFLPPGHAWELGDTVLRLLAHHLGGACLRTILCDVKIAMDTRWLDSSEPARQAVLKNVIDDGLGRRCWGVVSRIRRAWWCTCDGW
jgi:hypothetical protein